MEDLGEYVVEKPGSRRASVERREEILNVALSVLAETALGTSNRLMRFRSSDREMAHALFEVELSNA